MSFSTCPTGKFKVFVSELWQQRKLLFNNNFIVDSTLLVKISNSETSRYNTYLFTFIIYRIMLRDIFAITETQFV